MGRPDFRLSTAYLALPITHTLHDDNIDVDVDVDVINGDLTKVVHNGLPVEPATELEPELALPLGCRWRVPLI